MGSSDEMEWELSGADRKLAVGKTSKYGSQEEEWKRKKGKTSSERLGPDTIRPGLGPL